MQFSEMFSAEAQKPCPIDYALPGSSTLQQSNCSLEEQKKVINEGVFHLAVCHATCFQASSLWPHGNGYKAHINSIYNCERKKPMISSIKCEFDPNVVNGLTNTNQAQQGHAQT